MGIGSEAAGKTWRPVGALHRRVLGVLVEKAKTTPDTYPLSLNALVSGCNQKNNRFPQMQVEESDVEPVVDELRELGALSEVQGGRVERYRHLLYEWLHVNKFELAIMAELLLRGAQTIGELRGRADRMESLPDMATFKPVLESLIEKGLVLSLSPAGRGQIVTHLLYLPQELDRVKRDYAAGAFGRADGGEDPESDREEAHSQAAAGGQAQARSGGNVKPGSTWQTEVAHLQRELALLKEELEVLKEEVAALRGPATT